MSDDTTAEDIYAVIGTVVARLLKPDQHLTLQDITHALHHLGETARFLSAGAGATCLRMTMIQVDDAA
ncbi:hypothetical protein E05_07170 [Plautia stali symbiont]|nr:hypothetical protein E05_07170 [Plautia stali symbiont]